MTSFRIYLRVLAYMKPYWKRVIGAMVLMVLCAAFAGVSIGMVLPFVKVLFEGADMGLPVAGAEESGGGMIEMAPNMFASLKEQVRVKVLGFFAASSSLVALERICLVILILYFLKGLFTYLLAVTSVSIEVRVIRDLRNALYMHLHKLSLSYFHSSRTGQIVSRITHDVTLVRMSISTGFLQAMRDLLVVAVLGFMVFFISWRLALAAFVMIPIITVVIGRIGRRLRGYSTKLQEKTADVTSVLQETLSGIRVVKAFGMESFESAKFMGHTEGHLVASMQRQRAASLAPALTEFLGTFGGLVVLWYGGRQVIRGEMLQPEMFLIFLAAMLSIIKPAKTLSQASTKIQEGIAAGKRIFEILDQEPEITDAPDAVDIDRIAEGIEFESVSFSYNGSDRVLSDISFKVAKGQVVAIVGPSGAGKSTLVDLIPRFHDPSSGSVRIDGQDIRRVSVASLRALMGIVTQETILFNDTVRNNIAYGLEDVDLSVVQDAARAANAHDFISAFPEGYDTVVGDRGVKLSGGERQRLAIARAILKDPQVLIFDEATSALDTESEKLVQEAIERLLSSRTNFVIAHRLSTVTHADLILVIADGRIVETGRHEELLAAGKVYRKLYDLQFKNHPLTVKEA
jgi:subfamily B ATP-binding cassette protein MsbA